MSLQREFSICLSEAYQTTQNLMSLYFKTPLLHSKNPQNELRSSYDTVYYMLCVVDEFLFPLAKPSRSFQNLTETPPRKRVLLSSFYFSNVVNENRLTNKLLLGKMILTTGFSIVKMLARDVTIFSGEKVSVVCFYLI